MKNEILEKIVQELLLSRNINRDNLDSFKRKMAKKHNITIPKNVLLLKTYHKLAKEKTQKHTRIEMLLRTRPVRSLSGIVNVSVLTKPYPCPGKCIFCPTEKNIPKSYLAKEPAVQRAILNKYSPYKQVETRLISLRATGHPIDKVELRTIGGTWSYYPKKYQTWFIKECFRACNEFNSKKIDKDLEGQQKKNEKAKSRIIGISVETRPDFIDIEEIKRMRKLGVTRVELGVQSIYDDVLELNKRGHKVSATIKATKLLKNAGIKVSYQMMPNLAGSSFKKDVAMFNQLFTNPDFMPDLLKIYPLALVKNCQLYKIYKQGKYKPYSKIQLTKLLVEIKKQIPYWCRVERVIRDIPSAQIVKGGTKTSNLRETVQQIMKEGGESCKCIRCREVGRSPGKKEKLYFRTKREEGKSLLLPSRASEKTQPAGIYLFREDYEASGGKEIFLTFENKSRTKLYALLRLRLRKELSSLSKEPSSFGSFDVLKNSSIIREIHTYGQMTPVGGKATATQHKGLGKKLMKEVEKITVKETDSKKIAVISGVGTREYYRKLSYKLQNTYMIKKL